MRLFSIACTLLGAISVASAAPTALPYALVDSSSQNRHAVGKPIVRYPKLKISNLEFWIGKLGQFHLHKVDVVIDRVSTACHTASYNKDKILCDNGHIEFRVSTFLGQRKIIVTYHSPHMLMRAKLPLSLRNDVKEIYIDGKKVITIHSK